MKELSNRRDKFFRPLMKIFAALKIKPSHLSLAGILMMLGFIYFLPTNIYLASLFVLIHIILDGMDGPLARYLKISSNGGALLDIISDQMVLVIGVLAAIFYSIIEPFWGSFYAITYVLFIMAIVISNYLGMQPRYVIRTKYFFFIFLLVDRHFDITIMYEFLIIFSIYMVLHTAWLFAKLIQKINAAPQKQK